MKKIRISNLHKVWLIDIDGTIVKHNGYLNGKEEFLSGAKEFLDSIPPSDKIIFLTSRKEKFKEETLRFLKDNMIRFDFIIFDLPEGERILINDIKPGGLKTAICVNVKRDSSWDICFEIDQGL